MLNLINYLINMKKFIMSYKGTSFPVYVNTLTTMMQMRIKFKSEDGYRFETTLDYHHGLWVCVSGVWGETIEELIYRYLRLPFKEQPVCRHISDIVSIYICDDPIYEDHDNPTVNGVITQSIIEDVKSLDE